MSEDRAVRLEKKRIHSFWRNFAETKGGELEKLVGTDAYFNILETDGDYCYACGKKCKTQRAHIVPDCLGGSNEESNMFLLCIPCHRANPDTIYKDMFFNYVRNVKPYITSLIVDVVSIIENLKNNCSFEDKKAFDKFMELPQVEINRLLKEGITIDKIGVGVYNANSNYTIASALWKVGTT